MTTKTMSEQAKTIVKEAISKFYSAFWLRVDSYDTTIVGMFACLVYLMKKRYVSIQTNVSDRTDNILSIMDLPYIEMTSKLRYEEWKSFGIYNQVIVADFPNDDPMAEVITKQLILFRKFDGEPSYIFEFFETISRNEDGDLYYLHVLDIALSGFFSKPMTGEFSQPSEFAELASALIDSKGKNIYNPFSGLMSFATSMKDYISFTGVEKKTSIAEVSNFRLHLADLQDKAHCIGGDVRDWTHNLYDIIVANPPIGTSLPLRGEKRPIRSDMICLSNFEQLTTSNGLLFSFVTSGSLFVKDRSWKIRQELTEKNYLDAVISLPANLQLPYTSVNLAVVILKKNRSKDAPIKMLDASDFYLGDKKKPILDVKVVVDNLRVLDSEKCFYATQDDIRRGNFDWSVHKYLNQKTQSFPDGYTVLPLGDVVEQIRGSRHFEEKSGHFAQISGLSSDIENCLRSVDSFEFSDDLSHAAKITEPVILLSPIRFLKPTYCTATLDNPIFLHPLVWAFRVKSNWVSPLYLCLELSRRYISSGESYSLHFSRQDLLSMKVAFPSLEQQRSLEEQNNLYNEAASNAKLAKAKELGLQSLIDSMKAEYINIVRMRKHDMKPYMRELGSISRMLRHYMDSYEPSQTKSKIGVLLDRFEDAYNHLSDLLDVFSEESNFGTAEKLNIDLYLREFVRKNKDTHTEFFIDYYCDVNAVRAYGIKTVSKSNNGAYRLFIDIARMNLDQIISNIIENARTHGFTDSERKDYQILISLTIDSERDMVQIDFSNNGNPLPKGLDKYRYGLLGEKAGATAGTGQGGHIVKTIAEHFGGDYDIFMDGSDTVVRVLFPISNNYE